MTQHYKIDYQIFGFDTGEGLPKPIDYRDHPEKYRFGDYPPEKLTSKLLPPKTSIIYGKINETLINFKNQINKMILPD